MVQTFAVVVRHDLISVCRRNGRYGVTVNDTGLHEVDGAVLDGQFIGKILARQIQKILDDFNTVDTLILQVVDRVDRLDVGVIAVLLIVSVEKQRHHAGLPVVAVEDIRLKAHEVPHKVQNCSLEEAETLDVEYILHIDLIEIEVIFVIYEVELHSI